MESKTESIESEKGKKQKKRSEPETSKKVNEKIQGLKASEKNLLKCLTYLKSKILFEGTSISEDDANKAEKIQKLKTLQKSLDMIEEEIKSEITKKITSEEFEDNSVKL